MDRLWVIDTMMSLDPEMLKEFLETESKTGYDSALQRLIGDSITYYGYPNILFQNGTLTQTILASGATNVQLASTVALPLVPWEMKIQIACTSANDRPWYFFSFSNVNTDQSSGQGFLNYTGIRVYGYSIGPGGVPVNTGALGPIVDASTQTNVLNTTTASNLFYVRSSNSSINFYWPDASTLKYSYPRTNLNAQIYFQVYRHDAGTLGTNTILTIIP